MMGKKKQRLSDLENLVMQVIWKRKTVTAEDIRVALNKTSPMKDSTARTILRRLEGKGYVKHAVEGRTFVYQAKIKSQNVASEAIAGIVEKFCDGSIENLLVGMVDNNLLTPTKLRQLAAKIEKAEKAKKTTQDKKPVTKNN